MPIKAVPMRTGFFDAAARAEGQLTPDEATVHVRDANALCASDTVHPQLDFGRFRLWPKLTAALRNLAGELAAHGVPEEFEQRPWAQACEEGALLFLRSVLLDQHHMLGVPANDAWPDELSDRCCERFGEAYASFAHTDLRVAGQCVYNIWVPVANVESEHLLLFAANAEVDAAVEFRAARNKAHHLPMACAELGEWYYFPGLTVGDALIFPGDGGGHKPDSRGIFHCSEWASAGTRQSFDVRELLVPHGPRTSEACAAEAVSRARDRLRREVAEWEARLAGLHGEAR